MPASLLVPLLLGGTSTALNLIGAKKSSDAAKDAAKIQQEATNRALETAQAVYAPYLQVGQLAAQRLMGPALAQPYTQAFTGPGGSTGYQAYVPGPMPDVLPQPYALPPGVNIPPQGYGYVPPTTAVPRVGVGAGPRIGAPVPAMMGGPNPAGPYAMAFNPAALPPYLR